MRECPIATSSRLRPQLMLIGRNRQLHNSADDVRDIVLGIVCAVLCIVALVALAIMVLA